MQLLLEGNKIGKKFHYEAQNSNIIQTMKKEKYEKYLLEMHVWVAIIWN